MAATSTGYNPLFGLVGTDRIHELVRSGAYVLAEATSEAVAAGTTPCPVSVLRREVTAAGNSARGIAATWGLVAGLEDISGIVHMPGSWADNPANPNAVQLLQTERIVFLVDVPAGGDVAANRITTKDRLSFVDSVYGLAAFEITEIAVDEGAGMVRARVRYAREGGQVP